MTDLLAPFGRLRRWHIVAVLAAAAAAWGLARLSGVDTALWQLALLALAALATGSFLSSLRPDVQPRPELRTATVNSPSWRPFTEVNRWEDQLIFAEAKPGRFAESNARRQIAELAAERLRLRRGLHLDTDPEQCRDLLGADTVAFLTGTAVDPPTAAQLDRHLTKIEEI